MEQLRTVFQFVHKQYFWLLGGLVVVIGVLAWFFAQSAVNAAFETNKDKIEAAFTQQQSIVSRSPHFNDNTITGQRSEVVELRDHNFDLWNRLYDRQQSTVLKWPTDLGSDFVDEIDNFRFGDELPPRDIRWMPDRYRTYIKGAARKLPKIVEAKTENFGDSLGGMGIGEGGLLGAGRGGGREGTGDDEVPVEEDYIVIWEDYGTLEAELTWPQAPSSMQIWVAQEDLWVYETLLRVIAQVNENAGATGNHDAAIRVIHRLEVGRLAASTRNSSGRILAFAAPGMGAPSEFGMGGEMGERGGGMDEMEGLPGGMMGGREMMGGGGMMDMGERGGVGGEEGGEGGDPNAMWLQGRYLNAKGEPTDGTAANGDVEFKRLPVRMVLTMDLRQVTPLLVECANAPLPIEIEQVRANVGMGRDGAGGGGFMGGGGRGGMMMGGGERDSKMDGGRDGMMGVRERGSMMGVRERGGRVGSRFDDAEEIALKANTQIITVILHGTVFIYNRPDKEAMKLPWEDGGDAGNSPPFAIHPTRNRDS